MKRSAKRILATEVDGMKVLLGGLGIGLAAGILAGMVGIGGGLIIVPGLVYVFGIDQRLAQGTSLLVLLPPSGVCPFLAYYKAGHVDVKLGLLIFLGVLLGGYLGGRWAQRLSGLVLRRGFAAFMMIAAVNMWFKK